MGKAEKYDELLQRLASAGAKKPGDGLDRGRMNALAHEIVAAKDWDELVSVRNELRRRPSTPDDANHWRFGVSVFNGNLRRHGPAQYAVQGLSPQPGARSINEVVGRFSWRELDPLIANRALRKAIARERVARGEDLRNAGIKSGPFEPPMWLEPWEPQSYESSLDAHATRHDSLPPAGDAIVGDAAATDPVLTALETIGDLGDDIRSVKVHGNALEAIEALGYTWAVVDVMSLPHMLAQVAHDGTFSIDRAELLDTKRRFAWDLLSAITNTFSYPKSISHSERLRLTGERLRWVSFSSGPEDEDEYDDSVWRCLAVEDPERGLAWAMAAVGPCPW